MKIEVRNLSKKYRDKEALKGLTFTLDGSKIYGLLGRNGAGKTTFMDILAGQMLPTEGEVLIDGERPFDNRRVTEKICLIKEGSNFKKDLKIKHILKIYSYFYPNWDQEFAEKLLEVYSLNKKMTVKTMSKGMESALGIIVGLASKAPITIFDEPYIGMDAPSRKRFYDILLEEYESEKRLFIFSTHLIDEVSLLFEEVLIIQDGALALKEEAENLRENTCAISGPIKEVEAFISGRDVIEKKQLAGMMTAYIHGNINEAKESGLQVEGIPIQELMIHMTQRKEGE